jgi:Zn-dependent M28 family amino/carboxypeptidase
LTGDSSLPYDLDIDTDPDTTLALSTTDGVHSVPFSETLSLPTRYTYSPQHRLAASFLKQFFYSLNFTTDVHSFGGFKKKKPSKIYNVVAQCRGRTRPDEIILVGAHFDSTSERPMERAPGAVDDGSGAAGVMVLARAMSQMFPNMQETGCLDRTVMFALFGGEEQGLLGSKYFVKQVARNPASVGVHGQIAQAILMDMIAYSKRYFGLKIEGTYDVSSCTKLLLQRIPNMIVS